MCVRLWPSAHFIKYGVGVSPGHSSPFTNLLSLPPPPAGLEEDYSEGKVAGTVLSESFWGSHTNTRRDSCGGPGADRRLVLTATESVLTCAHRGGICVHVHPGVPGRWASSTHADTTVSGSSCAQAVCPGAAVMLGPGLGSVDGGDGLEGSSFISVAETEPDSRRLREERGKRAGSSFQLIGN